MGLNTSIHACDTRFYHINNASHYQSIVTANTFKYGNLAPNKPKTPNLRGKTLK